MKMTTIAALLLVTTSAHAADLVIGGFSYHFFKRYFNENNPSIGLVYGDYDVLYVHDNSVGHKSVQLARCFKMASWDTGSLGLRAGIMTGYKRDYKWTNNGEDYYYEGSKLELGHSGVLPLVAVEVKQNLFGGVGVVADVAPEVIFVGLTLTLK